ncbi:MAG: hypothetical protein AAF802_17365 [Planctomycetota bacterium]
MAARFSVLFLVAITGFGESLAEDAPPVEAMLMFAPVMGDVEIDTPTPERIGKLVVKRIAKNDLTGWQLQDQHRAVLRRFLDTNGDNKVDRWIYFRDGREVYRDADTDYDGTADTARRTFRIRKDRNGELAIVSRKGEETGAGNPKDARELPSRVH